MKNWLRWLLILLFASLSGWVINRLYFAEQQTYHSENPNAAFFYPLDTIAKIYHFRNVANGLEEEFHRIYMVEDAVGPHLIVEIYSPDGRLREAINYNVDSLVVQDHMVVNRLSQKEKALIYKNQLFPFNLKKETWFASKFSGVTDSTIILQEIFRNFDKKANCTVLKNKNVEALYFNDKIRRTALNPFTHTEKEVSGQQISVFAKGYGLIEWYNRNNSLHFRLERILSQKEWVKIINR